MCTSSFNKVKHITQSVFPHYTWTGWRRWFAFAICFATIVLLGMLRAQTDGEFTFASLALIPVLIVTWIAGRWPGLAMAFLATSMWLMTDFIFGHIFSAIWIPWLNAFVRLANYSLVVFLAATVRRQLQREHEYASSDAMTGLSNRRAFMDVGISEVERARRYNSHLAVVFLDLDDFKKLNDSKGHHIGDAALKATADALTSATRSNDCVSRLGGDEFAVIFPEIGYEDAILAGQKMFSAVNAALANFPPAKGSVGVAWFEKVDRTFPEMIEEADKLMYAVKTSGKNNIASKRFSGPANKD
jgi:diguanylate cyclase (GGDEF)-like protein